MSLSRLGEDDTLNLLSSAPDVETYSITWSGRQLVNDDGARMSLSSPQADGVSPRVTTSLDATRTRSNKWGSIVYRKRDQETVRIKGWEGNGDAVH